MVIIKSNGKQKHTAVYLSGPPRPGSRSLGPPQHRGPQQAWLSAVQPHGQRLPDWPSSQEIQQAKDKALFYYCEKNIYFDIAALC